MFGLFLWLWFGYIFLLNLNLEVKCEEIAAFFVSIIVLESPWDVEITSLQFCVMAPLYVLYFIEGS